MKLVQTDEVQRDLVVEVRGDSVMIGVADPDCPEACSVVFELQEDGYYEMLNSQGDVLCGHLVCKNDKVGFE